MKDNFLITSLVMSTLGLVLIAIGIGVYGEALFTNINKLNIKNISFTGLTIFVLSFFLCSIVSVTRLIIVRPPAE